MAAQTGCQYPTNKASGASESRSNETISSTGRVSRVFTKYAYITSNHYGGVFAPLSSAVPTEQFCPDMKSILVEGDIVHFKAVPQHGKNDCAYRATQVKKSSNTDLYQSPPGTTGGSQAIIDMHGCIVSVFATYAFIMSDGHGLVFFPGSAYQKQPSERARLNTVFSEGDRVVFSARSQSEKRGCCWLALCVVRADEHIDGVPAPKQQQQQGVTGAVDQQAVADTMSAIASLKVGNEPTANHTESSQSSTTSNVTDSSSATSNVVECSGRVIMHNTQLAIVKTDVCGCVLCPALTMDCGPEGPESESVLSLSDVIKNGDRCVVLAKRYSSQRQSGCQWRALRWAIGTAMPNEKCSKCLFTEIVGCCPTKTGTELFNFEGAIRDIEVAEKTMDKVIQTNVTAEYLLLRAIKMEPELYNQVKMQLPHVVEYAESMS